MQDFLSFRRMITPVIIQIIFWLYVAFFVIGGFVVMFSGSRGSGVLPGIGMVLLGPVVARIFCEILIIMFRMNETLTDIRAALRGQPPVMPVQPVYPPQYPPQQPGSFQP
jgi:hypothetical protein